MSLLQGFTLHVFQSITFLLVCVRSSERMTPYRECGETLPIINKPKHPKKGEYNEQNGRIHVQEDKRTTKEDEPQREHQVPQPLILSREAYQMRKGCDLLKGCHYREGFSFEEATCKVASSYLKWNKKS